MSDQAILSLHSVFVCVSVLLGVASQLSNLRQICSGSSDKQKTFERDFFFFYCMCSKCDLHNLEADVTSCVNCVTGIDFVCEYIAVVLNYKYTEQKKFTPVSIQFIVRMT